MTDRLLVAWFSTVVAACAQPVHFAEWVVPVPEETQVIDYPAITREERVQQLTIEQDLVIGRDVTAAAERFYVAFDVAVDGSGAIYVADTGNHRIQVFDESGGFLRTLGRAGQGPGEFQRPREITIAGDDVVVLDTGNYKFSLWEPEGRHENDHGFGGAVAFDEIAGLPDGSLVALVDVPADRDRTRTLVGRWSSNGQEIQRYAELQAAPGVLMVTRSGRSFGVNVPASLPSVAVGREQGIYLSAASEYQVHAYSTSGEMAWALRVAQPADPLPAEWIEASLQELRQRVPDVSRTEIAFPEVLPVLSGLEVDGHGHLYVFHYVLEEPLRNGRRDPGQQMRERGVDVYSADGRRLFAGTTTLRSWDAALEDWIYRVETDPLTDERIVVRYRLVEPF